MAVTEQLRESLVMMVGEDLTPQNIIAKAHGLALLMGVNLPKPRIETEADLDKGLDEIRVLNSHTMTELFIGAQKNDEGVLVPRVWVEQGYLVTGGGKLIINVGVETGPGDDGEVSYWFEVKTIQDVPKEVLTMTENFNWIGRLMTGFLTRNLLFYTPQSEREIWRTILAADPSEWCFNDPRRYVTNTDY